MTVSCGKDGNDPQVLEDGSLEKILHISGRLWAEGQIQIRVKESSIVNRKLWIELGSNLSSSTY